MTKLTNIDDSIARNLRISARADHEMAMYVCHVNDADVMAKLARTPSKDVRARAYADERI